MKGGLEKGVYKDLLSYQRPHTFTIEYETENIPYVVEHHYTPDFVITRKDGSKLYIEAKGWLRSEDKRKMRAVKLQHPTYDIRIVFQKDNPLYKGSKSKYSDWARKLGFPYAIGTIPKDWIFG